MTYNFVNVEESPRDADLAVIYEYQKQQDIEADALLAAVGLSGINPPPTSAHQLYRITLLLKFNADPVPDFESAYRAHLRQFKANSSDFVLAGWHLDNKMESLSYEGEAFDYLGTVDAYTTLSVIELIQQLTVHLLQYAHNDEVTFRVII